MEKIYLVLTNTGTFVSNLIRKHTGDIYNHVSIGLKRDLGEMYSFGRLNPYVFFYGGFVVESPNRGTFKRFGKTVARVYELPVEDNAYAIIEDCIARFIAEKGRFGYNFRGILKARKNVNYQKTYRRFYCSQFVNYLLVCSHVISEKEFEGVVTPEKLSKIKGMNLIYEGLLREYSAPEE